MKKYILAIIILASTHTAFACEICGGGLGSNYVGLLPEFSKRFLGIRYQYNQLYTQLDINGQQTALSNRESYRTAELWGAWNIGSKWRILALLPYSFIERENIASTSKSQKDGLGDMTLSGYYNMLNRASTTAKDKRIMQSLWIGMGIKLPFGHYDQSNFTNSTNVFQLGTGSLDFIPHVSYDIRYQDLGLNTNLSYKINTENNEQYRYGNKIMASANLYYKVKVASQAVLSPNIGLSYDRQDKDKTMGYKIDESGGNSLTASAGLETNFDRISCGVSYQQPIQQNLALGRTEIKQKLTAHVSFAF